MFHRLVLARDGNATGRSSRVVKHSESVAFVNEFAQNLMPTKGAPNDVRDVMMSMR
jgi:hypothetical protein